MHSEGRVLALVFLLAISNVTHSQDVRGIVQQAVQTELKADAADHTHWLFFDVDDKPNAKVTQWVAEAAGGDFHRVLVENGRALSPQEQQSRMDSFVRDKSAQVRQRKSGHEDDRQAAQMLQMLPNAFVWTKTGEQEGRTLLHFAPDPRFRPPNRQARVFSAMEGQMTVDNSQHRIASLKGRMIHKVDFGGGLLGRIDSGGSFGVERRETGDGVWQITETHVHIHGRALVFKTISDEEDDVKSRFKQIDPNLSLADAEKLLMTQKQ